MPDHQQPSPLLEIETSGFTFAASLLLVAALGCLLLQALGLLDGINPDKSIAIQLIPGALGLGLLLLFGLKLRQTGQLKVFPDQISGKRPNGLPIAIAMHEVAQVELNGSAIALKDAQGKLMLLQRMPQKNDGGIVWLLKEYANWDPSIWKAYARVTTVSLQKATRHFMGEDEQVTFADVGFVVSIEKLNCYLPESVIVDVRTLGARQIRMNQKSRRNTDTLLQFQPSPDLLPLGRLVAAILSADVPQSMAMEYIETLVELHGGSQLKRHPGSQEWDGECLGYAVQVFPS